MLLSADHEEIQDLAAVDALRAGRREWIGLAVLALPCLLYAMDLSVLNLAVPALSADLRPSSTQLLWIGGHLRVHRRRVAGHHGHPGRPHRPPPAAAAGRHGVWCRLGAGRLCDQPGLLIGARALLGVAGATLAPSTLSLIRNMFADPRQRTVAISVWVTSFSAGGAIGPLLGGVLLEWRARCSAASSPNLPRGISRP